MCFRTSDVYSSLKSWGLLENIKGEARVVVSFADKIAALHDDFMSLAEHEGTPGHKDRTANLKMQRAKDFGSTRPAKSCNCGRLRLVLGQSG